MRVQLWCYGHFILPLHAIHGGTACLHVLLTLFHTLTQTKAERIPNNLHVMSNEYFWKRLCSAALRYHVIARQSHNQRSAQRLSQKLIHPRDESVRQFRVDAVSVWKHLKVIRDAPLVGLKAKTAEGATKQNLINVWNVAYYYTWTVNSSGLRGDDVLV